GLMEVRIARLAGGGEAEAHRLAVVVKGRDGEVARAVARAVYDGRNATDGVGGGLVGVDQRLGAGSLIGIVDMLGRAEPAADAEIRGVRPGGRIGVRFVLLSNDPVMHG